MNAFVLLATGAAVVVLGQRFWGRLLRVLVFRAAASERRPFRIDSYSCETGSAVGVVAVLGASLALAWGWAPAFVWLLAQAAVVGVFLNAGLGWLQSMTPAHAGPLPLETVLGARAAQPARAALGVGLLLLMPIALSMAVALLCHYPNALYPLLAHFIVASLAPRVLRGGPLAIAAALPVVALLLPLSLRFAERFDLGDLPGGGPGPLAVAALCLLLPVLSRWGKESVCRAFGAVNLVGLSMVSLLVFTWFALEAPLVDAGRRGGGGALPLVFGCLALGVAPLLPSMRRRRVEAARPRADGAAAEGLFALVALLVVAAAFAAARGGAAHWSDAPDVAAGALLFVESVGVFGARLPFGAEVTASFAAYAVAAACLNLIDNVIGVLGEQVVATPRGAPVSWVGWALLALAGLQAWLHVTHGVAALLWIVTGAFLLLFCAALAAALLFAMVRLRRPWGIAGAVLAGAGACFWWLAARILLAPVVDHVQWTWAIPGILVVALGAFATWRTAESFLDLRRARRERRA